GRKPICWIRRASYWTVSAAALRPSRPWNRSPPPFDLENSSPSSASPVRAKTTLLRCLACSIPVTEGSICCGDQDLAALYGAALRLHRARVGMIYQQFNLVRRLRVLDNVLIGRLAHLTSWR